MTINNRSYKAAMAMNRSICAETKHFSFSRVVKVVEMLVNAYEHPFKSNLENAKLLNTLIHLPQKKRREYCSKF